MNIQTSKSSPPADTTKVVTDRNVIFRDPLSQLAGAETAKREVECVVTSKSAISMVEGYIVATQETEKGRVTVKVDPEQLWEELQTTTCCGLRSCGNVTGETGPMGSELVTESGERLIWLSTIRCLWMLVMEAQSVPLVTQALIHAGQAAEISCILTTELQSSLKPQA